MDELTSSGPRVDSGQKQELAPITGALASISHHHPINPHEGRRPLSVRPVDWLLNLAPAARCLSISRSASTKPPAPGTGPRARCFSPGRPPRFVPQKYPRRQFQSAPERPPFLTFRPASPYPAALSRGPRILAVANRDTYYLKYILVA